ncbi:MerR family transcriptional regulator [Paenibacillus sp. YN15]|uniref:MerR family transcriptional regulator n=1 Tax=Paenibacillus sp. YN15 TaxID=1742774 RepID=UPI000DCC981C|nr:MerR family transcriptional regulator [Paenibacillus sp. YN15]RAU95951.1 hypothetical protein DQG13_21280 [Paenibacillus sp. YN15]
MGLVKITDLTNMLGITSRSLRYYEQEGLIQSARSYSGKYRCYDAANIERLKQIMVLRKMKIPIKDIIRIYGSADMSVVVETFVNRIRAIDEEVNALTELRRIVNEFLLAMMQNGITKISALPILYEKMEKQLDTLERSRTMSYDELSAISDRLSKPIEPSIVALPPMRVLSSCLKGSEQTSDPEGFWRWVQTHGLAPGAPGAHERFEFQTDAGDITVIKIADDFENKGPYADYRFEGGLFAAANVYLDEDMSERFRSLVSGFDGNPYYEIDYTHDGRLRHEVMLEDLISPDGQRSLVSLLVPVKKRLPDSKLFRKPEEMDHGSITVEEIENANPILWTQDVAMDQLIPINRPHYRVTEQGEAEFISWIATRVLSTHVAVRLPFRVDMEFLVGDESGGWGHGKNDGSIRFHHGEDLNYLFGVNMNNNPDERLSQEAICFHQPVFGDYFSFPKRGGINPNIYNHLTWIAGPKHFAVILNGEVRYCGVNFPYMAADISREPARPIILGSNSSIKKYFRSIRVSQLVQVPKSKIKEGALTVNMKQSNNTIPNLHRFITSEYGENYWFNGCARYVMECLGEYIDEPDFGYWFFAGLTGDILAQVYSYGEYMGEAVSSCRFVREGGGYLESIFEKCGYASTFVTEKQLLANKEMYVQTMIAYIDKGVPVIAVTRNGPPWGIYVGYEEHGKTLLYLTGDKTEPDRVPLEQVIDEHAASTHAAKGWLFVGEKKRPVDLKQIYRDVILDMPRLFTVKTDAFCFGPEAFRAWANGIENGKFDGMMPEEFDDGWAMHTSNICNMATNGSCVFAFLERAQALNPDFAFLEEIGKLYRRTAEIWNRDNGNDLEALGGGFNVTLINLQDKDKRSKIAARIREAALCMDKVLEILNENLHE